jgi:hypothetical protein
MGTKEWERRTNDEGVETRKAKRHPGIFLAPTLMSLCLFPFLCPHSFVRFFSLGLTPMGPFGRSLSLGVQAMTRKAILGIVALLAVVGLGLYGLSLARTEWVRVAHTSNLDQLAKGVAAYLTQIGESRFYPASIGSLFDLGVIKEKSVFVSPADPDPPKLPDGLPCSFESCFDTWPTARFSDDYRWCMMVWDRKPFFGDRRYVAYFDYRVERVNASRFEQLRRDLLEKAAKNKR